MQPRSQKKGNKEDNFHRDEFGDLMASFDGNRGGPQSRTLPLDIPCEKEFVELFIDI